MNTKTGFFLLGCGVAVISAAAQSSAGRPQLSSAPSAEKAPSATASPDAQDSSPLTRAEAQQVITESRQYVAHPAPRTDGKPAEPEVVTPGFDMPEPPPAPLTETKPPAPAPNQVWVPGHFMPVKKQWRWVRGEWAVPATPSSVWIPARYDEKDKKWSPGYWQPDVPAASPTAETAKSGEPAAKSQY